jgi:hypothetical protein
MNYYIIRADPEPGVSRIIGITLTLDAALQIVRAKSHVAGLTLTDVIVDKYGFAQSFRIEYL